jgi:gluconolactonase
MNNSLGVCVPLCSSLLLLLSGLATAKETRPVTTTQPAPEGKDFEALDARFRAVIRSDSAVVAIAKGLKFTEGPVWVPDRAELVFSDIPAGTLYQWAEGKDLAVFRKPSHNANGNTLDMQGRLITCEHGSRTVTRTDADGKVATIASTYKGGRLNSPNDAAVKSDGTIWFTDPPYGLPKGAKKEQAKNYVFRLDPNAAEPVVVADDFDMPNGLCFSPEEKLLYVADSGKPHHVRRFAVGKDNTLSGGKVFAAIQPGVPDGIRCDEAGRLFSTAGDGVQVFDADGTLVGRIRTPEPAANCCFGGADRTTLFITARTAVYAVKLAVAGAQRPKGK